MRAAARQIPSTFVRNLVVRRHLIGNFVRRDLHARYVGSMGGLIWALVHPVVLLISYYFVFQLVLRVPVGGAAGGNFAVFVFAAILPWLYVQDTLSRGCGSVVEGAGLLRKTVFPAEILPLTVALSNLVVHTLSVALFALAIAPFGLASPSALLIPLYLVPLVLATVGLAWLLAALQVFVRDTSQLLAVGLVFWFWLTPIFYDLAMVPSSLRPIVAWNPLTVAVAGYRTLLLEGGLPSMSGLGFLWAFAGVALLAGGIVFRVLKREFVDVL